MKQIELLNKLHNRNNFDCGIQSLNEYLKQIARQHIKKGLSRTFVFIETEKPAEIIGFFTLSLCEIQIEKLPDKFAKKYPSKVSGVKLARLAVDYKYQRQGIGDVLIISAMKKALIIAENAGIIGLFVDAKDQQAENYYKRYNFVNLRDSPLQLFLPLSIINNLINCNIK